MDSVEILIVDDHELFRRSLRTMIEARPDWHVCGEAADGKEAIELTSQLRPDLILLDVSMPEMNGLEAARYIQRESPDSQILIVSQNDTEPMQKAAAQVGARGFVAKAKIFEQLASAIDGLTRNNGGEESGEKVKSPENTASGGNPDLDFLAGESEMAGRMRRLDWSQTALGPVEGWPQSLKTSVSICLASRFPIVMYWGPQYVVLYNDAYSTILGSKHPWALGQPCRVCWAEIWDTIGPMLYGVVNSGQATWSDDLLLMLQRRGYPEECYFSFSFSPIRIESGIVGGVFTAVMETTDKVVGERRLRTLRDLAARAVNANSEPDALRIAAETLSENLHDLPFSILCQAGQGDAIRILGTAGIDQSHPLCTALTAEGSKVATQVLAAVHSREITELTNLTEWPGPFPVGAWKVPPHSALILPIGEIGRQHALGFLLAGVNPHKAPTGAYHTFFGLVAHQITNSVADARSHEAERERAEALAELDRAKTLFFSNVSHEFRTPLTLMLGPLEDTLAARDGLTAEQREQLEVAHRNSLRLLKLVNTLLDFSRIEAGRIQACYEPTDLSRLTAELASMFESATERAGLQLSIDCPAFSEPVYIDREMWEKIVFNLLSNAFKFTFEGEIRISLRQVNGAVELSVKDTGTGIPAEEIPQLFERFYRVRGARGRSYEGSGIGLALVQELVKLHGGQVRVESELNRGSTFTVSVPLGKDHLPSDRIGAERALVSTGASGEAYLQEALRWLSDTHEDDIPTPLPSPGSNEIAAAGVSGARPRILVADDNADMREYIRRLLSDHYEVITVEDGEAAIESARKRAPDLIISDVMMPRLDGFGLLQAIRNDESLKGAPVILLSARAGEEAKVEGLVAGADDYLVKPFSARELMARVKSSLAVAQLRDVEVAQQVMARKELERREQYFRDMVDTLPAAIYTTDAEGRLTHFNPAAVKFSGRTPELGTDQWCVSWKLYYPDGTPMPHDQCPMAIALKEGRIIEGVEAIAERPDGTRVWFTPYPRPLRDAQGRVVGGINMLLDITARKKAEEATGHLAAIVTSSDDAIVSKNLDGIITTWNKSAERIFGYSAEEAIGKHITLLIPPERHQEEVDILARLRRGERVDHFHTVRRRKDGTLLDVSLTISPVRDSAGRVVGASKVARDITAQIRTEQALRESEERFRALSESLDAEVRLRTAELERRSADVLRQSEQLRSLSVRLLQVQDQERRRVARELHDSAGQTLTVLGMSLAQLRQQVQRSQPQFEQSVRDAEQLVQQLHREIRTMSYLLHPPLLDEAGLGAALGWYLDGLRARSKLKLSLTISDNFERLPRDMELVIFRVVQEALTNIHRHSGSKTAAIDIARTDDTVTVEIRDQGKGMSPEKLAEIQSLGSGVGIRGMRERVGQFHGDLLIESDKNGTRVLVKIPVPRPSIHEERRHDPLRVAV